MKFFSDDPQFFSDVIENLGEEHDSIKVAQLNYWKKNAELFKKQWIVVDDSLDPRQIVAEVYQNKIPHLLQKNQGSFQKDLKVGGVICDKPAEYFESQFLMIGSEDVVTKKICFSGPDDKARLLEEVFQFLNELTTPSAVEAAFAVIEELYMNAVYDAPREAARLGLPMAKPHCEMFLARNRDQIQISCSDQFGALDLEKLFGRMHEVYEKGASEVIQMGSEQGAGIGCFLLFEKCRSLIFGVQKGVCTKVTALLPLSPGRKSYRGHLKSLHGFEVE